MWFDEALSLAYAQLSFLDIIRMVISDTQAPFYYLFLHIWILLGKSEFILRMSSAIFGIASVYLVYIVAERIFDKRVGLISTFIISISPFNIYYSQEVRLYALLVFLTLICLYITLRLLEDFTAGKAIMLIVSIAIGLYTHYYFLFVVLGLNIYILLEYFKGIEEPEFAKRWVISQSIAFFLFLPWIPIVYRQYFRPVVGLRMPIPFNLGGVKSLVGSIIDIFSRLAIGYSNIANNSGFFRVISLLFIILFVIGVIFSTREGKGSRLAVCLFLLPILLVGILAFHNNWLMPRYFVIFSPIYYIFIAKGISILYNNKRIIFFYCSIFLIGLVTSQSLIDYYYKYQKGGNWREAAQIVACSNKKDVPILVSEPINLFPFIYYYKETEGVYAIHPAYYRDTISQAFNRSNENWFLFSGISDLMTSRNKKILEYLEENHSRIFFTQTDRIDIYLFEQFNQ